jgi:uncharacterized phage protein (TIGR02218 family)
MSYASLETAREDGDPFFAYLFTEGAQAWRFTSAAEDWTSEAQAADASGSQQTWGSRAISHSAVSTGGGARRTSLEITLPITDAFARRFLVARDAQSVVVTIYRAHAGAPGFTVAEWKGRVLGAATSGQTIRLTCDSVFAAIQRLGVRAKYQRLCRHALYGDGCGLAIADFRTAATVSARSGLALTVAAAAAQADGYWRGGVLGYNGSSGYIRAHTGSTLALSAPMPGLFAALTASGTADVLIAPGCDLRRETCAGRFGNIANHGGFPDIPARNPFEGSIL